MVAATLAACALAASTAAAPAPTAPTPSSPSPSSSSHPPVAADPPGWTRLEVPEAGFSAAFPGVATRVQMTVPAEGRDARVGVFSVRRAGACWEVVVTEPAGALSAKELERLPEGAAAFLEGVVRATPVRRQGRPAYEIEQRVGSASVLSLYVAGADRVYQVSVAVEGGPLPRSARAFLDGFRLVPIVAAPPAATGEVATWEERSPEGARFAARFPVAPLEQAGETAEGGRTRLFVAEHEGISYTVLVVPVRGAGAQGRAVVDGVVDEARRRLAPLGGTARIGEPATVSGLPSRDLTFEGAGTAAFVRVVAAPEAVYQVSVTSAKGEPLGPGRARFVDSFRVLER